MPRIDTRATDKTAIWPTNMASLTSRKANLLRTALIAGLCVGVVALTQADALWAQGSSGKSGAARLASSSGDGSGGGNGSGGGGGNNIGSLKGVKPALPNLTGYIKPGADAPGGPLQQLGKALFWDSQVGSDGQACASCHFHAGADIRNANSVNPGQRAVVPDNTFSPRAGAAGSTGPNQQLNSNDFPFRHLQDATDRESKALFDTNDVFSSQGTRSGVYRSNAAPTGDTANVQGGYNETCDVSLDVTNPFHAGGIINRKVPPRNTPSTINAVFNFRNFWDGRANNVFNGNDPFGLRTNVASKNAGVLVSTGGGFLLTQVAISNASLASQAVGPALSDGEMSCSGKRFANLGNKMLNPNLRPLARQTVHPQDSLLGSLPIGTNGRGINTTYADMIKAAFDPKFWSGPATAKIDVDANGRVVTGQFTQMEYNFSLFWGLAIGAYEAMLISDQSPFDLGTMSKAAKDGQNVFSSGKSNCTQCHSGPLMSAATVTSSTASSFQVLNRRVMNDGNPALFDTGFFNIGVRPTTDDIGLGGRDGNGFPLSFAREYRYSLLGQKNNAPDVFNPNACNFDSKLPGSCAAPIFNGRDAVDGAFKTPILRNVGLTAPYFHNGGQANLKDVMRFYSRGGDRTGAAAKDTTGFGPTPFGDTGPTNLSPDIAVGIRGLGLSEKDMDNLVQFMLALTDNRVACHAGPFDHPSLALPMGATATPTGVLGNDTIKTLPAVGAGGLTAIGKPCFPNTGDLFGTLDPTNPLGLQDAIARILQ